MKKKNKGKDFHSKKSQEKRIKRSQENKKVYDVNNGIKLDYEETVISKEDFKNLNRYLEQNIKNDSLQDDIVARPSCRVDYDKINSSKQKAKKKEKVKEKNKEKELQEKLRKEKQLEKQKEQREKEKQEKEKKEQEKRDKEYKVVKEKKNNNAVKVISILIILAIGLAMSPIFNVRTLKIQNNSKVTEEEIKKLLAFNSDTNMFRELDYNIREKLYKHPYIKRVDVKRIFPQEMDIIIEEEVPKYLLISQDKAYYVSDEGKVLEEVPDTENMLKPGMIKIISEVKHTDIVVGQVVGQKYIDLFNDMYKIMAYTATMKMNDNIEYIIMKKDDIVYKLKGEYKLIHFGTAKGIETKIMYLQKILEDTKDEEGEIYLNRNLNVEKPYFKKKV